MSGLTFHDLADDVARSIRALSTRPVVMLGHAVGNMLARTVTTNHPKLVTAVVLAAAEGSKVPEVGRQWFPPVASSSGSLPPDGAQMAVNIRSPLS